MKKIFMIIYIVIFMAVCMTPLILMPFVKNDAGIEKRELTPLPAYMKEGRLNIDFSTQFEAWFNDRIPLRAEMLSAANLIKGEMLGSPTSNVIVGKDGWLFYESEGADYMDTNAMSDAEVNAVAVTLSLIEENIEAKGGRFIFVPMPNKASVYSEYMPGSYKRSEVNNLSRIMSKLDETGVNYVNIRDLMISNKDKGLYHRRDSHWNYQGALLGYNAIMEGLPREHKTYSDAPYRVEESWRGDLDKLLYPAGGVMDEQYIYDIDYSDFLFTYPAVARDTKSQLEIFMSDREEGDDLIKTKNKELKDGSSLYMARDSFGRAVLPLFIDNYENAVFKRTDCPDINSIDVGTDFVFEIVERNLIRIAEKAPFMYAPERNMTITDGLAQSGEVTLYFDNEGYGIRLYGVFPSDEVSGDGRVYISLEQGGERLVYEAFPVYEKKMIESKEEASGENPSEASGKSGNKRGFSAIIDKEAVPSGNYKVNVISGNEIYSGGDIEIR